MEDTIKMTTYEQFQAYQNNLYKRDKMNEVYGLLAQLGICASINYKKNFELEQLDNIYSLIKGDLESIELAKQIILNRLNNA